MAAKAAKPTPREYEAIYLFNVPRNLTLDSGDSAEFYVWDGGSRRQGAWRRGGRHALGDLRL